MNVREIMTAKVQTATPSDTVGEARTKMRRGGFRRLPIEDRTGVTGIVVDSDLAGHSDGTPLGAVMHSPVVTASPDDPIEQAGRLMLEHRISVLPVLDDGHLVGILTESDLFEALCNLTGVMEPSTRIEAIITDRPQAIAEVMTTLQEHNVRVVSIVSAPPLQPGSRRLIVRVGTIHPGTLVPDLEKHGIHVIGPGESERMA